MVTVKKNTKKEYLNDEVEVFIMPTTAQIITEANRSIAAVLNGTYIPKAVVNREGAWHSTVKIVNGSTSQNDEKDNRKKK